jgi:hypothetical protein
VTLTADDRGPTETWPIMVTEDETKPLGKIDGGSWFTVKGQPGEYQLLPKRPIYDRGGTRLAAGELHVETWIEDRNPRTGEVTKHRAWRPTRRHPSGTYANGGRPLPIAQPPRRTKPLARIDLLARIPLFAARAPYLLAVGQDRDPGLADRPDPLVTRPGKPQARGWREAVKRLEKAGYTVVAVPDGRVTLASEGGHGVPELLDAFAEVADWIAAGMSGKPWSCAWCETEASRLLAGRVPACEEHVR